MVRSLKIIFGILLCMESSAASAEALFAVSPLPKFLPLPASRSNGQGNNLPLPDKTSAHFFPLHTHTETNNFFAPVANAPQLNERKLASTASPSLHYAAAEKMTHAQAKQILSIFSPGD